MKFGVPIKGRHVKSEQIAFRFITMCWAHYLVLWLYCNVYIIIIYNVILILIQS
jgi:hypothetical protein